MRKRRAAVIIVFCILGIAFLGYFTYFNGRHYLWFESYSADDDQPYGILFLEKMLASDPAVDRFTFNDKEPLRKLLKSVERPAQTDYVLIGHSIFLDDESLKALADFISAGGNVLIATLTPPTRLLDALYVPECNANVEYESNLAADVKLNFFHHSLARQGGFKYVFRVGGTDLAYPWKYMNAALFCDSTATIVPLGYQDQDQVDFIKISKGKGNLFLHSNPLVFTNYFLASAEKVRYVEGVFSHLGGRYLIWDEYSKIRSAGNGGPNGPLYYILRQPALKYAWWMLLATVALYIFFSAKRRQRVIPVLEAKSNTSLEFVNLISRLHYENGNHADMAHKKMKYFLYFVRSKYGIHAENYREEQIRRLAEKSKVALADVQAIFSQYQLIEEKFHDYIEPNRLVGLYEAIENFYSECK